MNCYAREQGPNAPHKDPTKLYFWFLPYIGPWNQNVRFCGLLGPWIGCVSCNKTPQTPPNKEHKALSRGILHRLPFKSQAPPHRDHEALKRDLASQTTLYDQLFQCRGHSLKEWLFREQLLTIVLWLPAGVAWGQLGEDGLPLLLLPLRSSTSRSLPCLPPLRRRYWCGGVSPGGVPRMLRRGNRL